MMSVISPRGFLKWGGIILIAVGILGMIGVIGPTTNSLFGDSWWFDQYENWAHLILGLVAIAALYVLPAKTQKPLVLIVGIVALFFVVWGFFVSSDFYGAMLENPLDNILHLVVGVWGVWAGMKKGMGGGM